MIKKEMFVIFSIIFSTLVVSQLVFALNDAPCTLTTSLINQDPYPAVPGDYVKIVFQVAGTENANCGDVTIKLNQAFPFTLDPAASEVYSTNTFFTRDYSSVLIAPYQVRVDKEALDGANPIEVAVTKVKDGVSSTTLQKFNVEIEDKRVEFEVYVKNYDTTTNILTLEILNIGKSDVKTVTVKVPEQENIKIKGPNTNVIGDLDSNEYTTADFEATSNGGKINLEILYTDAIDVRRTVEASVNFDPSYFSERKADEKGTNWWAVIGLVVIVVAGFLLYRRFKKKPKKVY